MEATEKSCEKIINSIKNDIDHATVDTDLDPPLDLVMQKHDAHLKIKNAKRTNGVLRDENFKLDYWGITSHANICDFDVPKKLHGNTYVMNFSKNNSCEDIVENIDEKIIAHQEIVKTLPEIDSDNKNKKPTTILFEKFKKKISVPLEFRIKSFVSFGIYHYEILDEINMDEIIKTRYDGIIKLIEHIYFNDYRPQYQNVRIKNLKEKLCEFYDGIMWKTIDESTLIHNIIVYTKDIMDSHFFKNKKKYSRYYQEKYSKYSDSFDEIIIKKMNGKIKNDHYEKIYERIRINMINKKKFDRVIIEKNKLDIKV